MNTKKLTLKQIQLTEKVRNLFSFEIGQKVIWTEGRYDHYFIETRFRDNGTKLYDLRSPIGTLCGGRVPENELFSA